MTPDMTSDKLSVSGQIRRYRSLFILVSFATVLSACGFHLRGALDLSQDVAPVIIIRNDAFDLARDIRGLLATNGIEITETLSTAKSRIALLEESRERRVLSVDSSGRASEYLLIYQVRYNLESADFKKQEFTARQQRSLVFDPDAVLAVENEADVLYGEMSKDIARSILLKLQAKTRLSASQRTATDKEKSGLEAATPGGPDPANEAQAPGEADSPHEADPQE